MTDIEQLMQNSEAMRMLKLGNPERSKDFNLPEMPIGLFDIERMVEEPLRNMIQNSKDPNGAIEKFDTALMLNNFGYDMDTAFSMADMGFASSVTGIDTRDKTYSQAFGTTVKHSYWNEMKGINTSLYMLTKNRYFIDNADKYNQKIMNNPVFNTYGEFGDLVLDSVQPALSSVKFMAVTALLSWIPGGIASAVWGPAIGKLVAGGGGLAANAVNFLSAGYSQAGDVLYNVMQMEDANGNRLPWDSLDAQVLYHGLAGLMGLLELGSMEMFPWYKHLKSRFTHREVVKHMERGILAAGKNFLWEGTKGTISESVEEGGQTILGIGYENLLKHWANKEGADFELTSIKETAKEAAEATYQTARSMVLTSFLSAGLGQSAYSLRLRAEAKKNFTPTANSVAVDSGFIGVPRSAVEAMEDGVAVGSMQPVKVVNVGDHLVPIDDVELKKAARAVKNGSGAMEVIVEGFPSIDTSDFTEMLHRAAIATEGKIINDSELGFETQEDLDRAMFLLALNVEAIEQNEKGSSIVIRNEDGEITKLQLSLIEEGQKVTEPDLSYIDDIQSPYSLAKMAEDKALEWHERNIIKEAIGDLVDHTKGRITSADLEANIDAVKLVADALKIPTDQMLKENLVFKLEKGTIKGVRGYIENVTVDGKKQYTIHLSENADATTLLHELGHFIRGTASKEQLADFTKYYGKGAEAVWIEDINKIGDKYHVGEQAFDSFEEAKSLIEANEEAFADDFVAYLRTGQAPTSGLRNIFRRLKTVLSRFVEEFGYRLDPFVKNAFDNLLSGRESGSVLAESSPQGMGEETFYQVAPPDYQPKSTGIGYKVFVQKDGKLYPPMVANPNGEETPVGKWLLADEAPIAAYSKTGRPQVKSGGRGTQGRSGLLAYRPGWHLGEIPYAKQFNRLNPATGIKELFPKDFVWAEVEYSKDNDYNDEARQNGVSKNGGFNHALASLHRMPTDGFYNYRTNPDPTTDPWIITGAMKVNKILTREEVETIVKDAGREPQAVEGDNTLFQKDLLRAEYAEVYDRYYNTDQWMKAPNGEWSNLTEQQWVIVRTPSFLKWFGNWIDDPKSVELALDENGEPEVFYHGSYTDDIEIFKIQPRLGYYFSDKNRGGFSFTNNREMAESYAVPQQKRVKAISNYLRELERALEDEGIVDLDSLEDPDDASPRLKRFYELLEEDEATAGETFGGHLPTFEYVYWDGDEFPFRQGREMWSKHVPRAIEKEFPELAKRLRKAGRDLRVGKGMTTPKVYEVFLRIPEGTNTKNLTPKTLHEIGDFFDVSKEKTGAFVVLMPEGEKVAYIADSKMIKSATDNAGTFDGDSPNILYQKTMDDRYFEALDRGDEETARKIVDDMARKRGYLSGNDFRMNHKAPNGRNDYDVNLPNLDGSELLPKDFWDHPRWYAGDHELYSFWKVKEAIDRYRRNGKANIRLYRAVPKDVREDWFRNGDWVTPDREYARTEGLSIPGGYRIIAHSVPIEHVWWDVNSIAELGYDDGGEYVYRNTKNNRKLFDTVVRDADGNIVPPSKRFNFRSDTLYQKAPQEGTKEFEQTFALTKIVDENGNPRMVYHGSMREWQGADTEFDPHEIGSQSDSGDVGEGFYFATTPLGAYAYTNGKQDNVHGYYLDVRNPFVIGEQYDRETTQAWEAIRQDEDPGVLPTVQMIADMVREAGYDPGELTKFRGYVSVYDVVQRVGSGNFSNLLKEKGYDGVVYGDEIVAFDPGQIYYASKPTTLYQIEAYHGTSKDFDKFSTDFIGSGFSGGAYGWGLYFTSNENIARDYAEIVGNRNLEKRALYRINLGRVGKHTLLPWSEPINERVRSMLREPMLKLEYPQSLHRDYGTSTTEELVSKVFGGNVTGNSLYVFLEKAFDDWSGKKASLFLREHGITGTVKSDLMGNYTYAIFDENAVEIVGKTLYQMAPPLGTEDFKKWYGSSVLVDGKGNPIELLHGSPSIFNDFTRTQKNDNGYLGAGHYFTEHRGVARTYATKNNDGYIYHAYLKMENPLRYDQEWDKKWTEIRNEVVAENPEVPENSNLFGKLLAEKLQDSGYDGVLDMRNGTVAEAVVFSNDQIGIVAVERYNLGEAESEYNRRKIGEMRQRFNFRSDTLYQKAPPKGSKEFQEIFKHTKAVNKDGSPALLYHGSPVTNLESLDNTNANKINGGEPGYTYATDSYEAADNFAYEQLPGSSSYTYIPGERGQIYEVYMDIRNPLDFRSLSPEDIANIKDAAQKYGPFEKEVTSTIDDFIIKGRDKYSLQFIKNMAEDVVKHLEEYGYDGLITELDNNGNLEYATVSPNQVFMVSTEGLDAGESFGAMNDNKNSSTLLQNARVDSYDGLEYIKHDEGYAYDEEKIRELDTEVTEVFEDIQRWFDFESGQDIPDTEGFSGNLSGRETSEVQHSWRESRRIDFVGKKIANVKDLAEMFSVYRNNEIELFHIIYVDDQNNILAHNALSSGLPGFTIAADSRTAARSLYRMESRMERLGASGYYLMHNHPSGNVSVSKEDLAVTSMYANGVDGFKGHIILDHTEFTLLKREEEHLNHSKDRYSPVKMDARKLLSESINSQDKVMTYVSEYLTDNNKNVYLIVDTQLRLIEARPVKRPSYLSAYEAMRSAKGSYVFLGTTDRSVFNEIIKNSEKQKSGIGVFRDVVLIDDYSSVSLIATTGKHPEWMEAATGKRGNKSRNKYLFDSESFYSSQNNSNVLYQLSAEEKKSLLEARKYDVKTAIEQFYWVPTEVLTEYVGEEWADNEIAFREHLRTYPWILEEARNHTEAEEFLEYLKENTEMGDYHWALEDELWFKRIHAYSRIMSPADKDAQFVRYHTRSNEALLKLGQQLKGYLDVVNIGKRSNRRRDTGMIISYRWGSFEGVSTIVKRLTADSTQAEFDRARKLIEDNPRPYRRALMLVEQAAARVEDFRGNARSVDASREAYYESFGEELAEALNEPVQLNEMTDRETARLLRESDDKKVRYDARERLATHAGVIAMEQQANAELKKLGEEKDASIKNAKKQLSMAQMRLQETTNLLKKEQAELREAKTALRKERARSENLTTRLEKKSVRASKVGQLERDLADRRRRVRQLRSELTAQNEKLRSTSRKVEILEGKLKTQRLRKALEGLHDKILATVKFNSDTLDASFEEVFNVIRSLFDQDQRAGGWKLLPQEMSQYLAEEHLHAIQQGRKINQWTLGDLEKLLEAAKLMRMDARVMLEKKKLQRMNNLANLSIQMYRQTYGENPEISVKYGSLMNDIIDDLTRKRDTYEENIFNAVFNTVRASVGKMQRIARMIDGHKEGVAYQLLVRDAYERMTEELRESYRRLNDADAKMKELKITSEYLVKDAFTYKTSSGQKKTLSKGEVIGLYVYSQNPVGAQKLVHNRGNNIPSIQLAEAIASLTDSDKSWGDYMIDSLGGDEVWERMRNTYYEVYNRNLGRRERYFTFVADGKIGHEGKTDLLVGPLGSKVRYVDKDFTKLINPNAIYPLKLNVTQTFTSQIKKQEHFVQWADWVRDMNYLLTRGAFGRIIDMNHGPKYLHAVQEYVNDVGSPQMILDDIERLGSKIISNAAVAVLSLNALTILKQLPSFATALRGDVGIMDFFGVAIRLLNPKTHAEAIKFIHEMSPYMQKRAISVEVERYNATDFDSYAGRKVQAFNEKIGMKGVHLADQAVVNTLWLAAYDTYIRRNPNKLEGDALKKEAAFRATQLISETQPTSIANDLSSIQRKKNPFARMMIMFSNQIFQYINMVWYDLPTSMKAFLATKDRHELRKVFGIVTNMAVAGGLMLLASGVAFKGDDDDEEYWKKIRREIASITATYTIPIVGNAVSQGVSGFYGGDLVDLPSVFGRMMGTVATDWEDMDKRLWDLLDGVGKVGGLPTTFINRTIRGVQNENPLELLGPAYRELWEVR